MAAPTLFGYEISSVSDQLRIHAVDGGERAFNLRRGSSPGLQSADGCVNQTPQYRNICGAAWRMWMFIDATFRVTRPNTSLRLSGDELCAFAANRYAIVASTESMSVEYRDQPEMNSVRDAYRGCKTKKPIFLLFRLVESTFDQAARPSRVSHVSVMVLARDCRLVIADFRLPRRICTRES